MTLPALYTAIFLSVASLVIGFQSVGLTMVGIIILVLGVGWFYAMRHGWYWSSGVGFLVAALLAAIASWSHISPVLVYISPAAALIAWDLSDFYQRLEFAAVKEDLKGLELRHFLRLGIIIGLGVLVSLLVARVQVRLRFEWAVILVLFAAWGITRLVVRLQQR